MEPRIAEIEGVILAGGKSRRMGTNKALLNWEGNPLIKTVAEKLGAVFNHTFIVANEPGLYADLKLHVFPDREIGIGPLGGIHSALLHARSEACFVVGCDMPFLDADLIRKMVSNLGESDAVVARLEGRFEPLHAIYRRRVHPIAERQIRAGDHSLQRFIAALDARVISGVELAGNAAWLRSFRNINTPEELESARQ